MDRQRTIARLWRDAVARWPSGDTAYLTREGAAWRGVTLGRSSSDRRGSGQRLPRARSAQGRRLRDPGRHHARLGADRLRPRARRRGYRSDLRHLLAARRRLCARALGRRRRPLRGRRPAREGGGGASRPAAPPRGAHVRRPEPRSTRKEPLMRRSIRARSTMRWTRSTRRTCTRSSTPRARPARRRAA